LQTRKWQDQSGQDRWTTEVVANDMQMLGGRGGDTGDRSQGGGGGGFRKNPQSQQAPAQPANDNDFADDDIPF